jgi:hypothetical protein
MQKNKIRNKNRNRKSQTHQRGKAKVEPRPSNTATETESGREDGYFRSNAIRFISRPFVARRYVFPIPASQANNQGVS